MAKNTGKDHRDGSVDERTQMKQGDAWNKRDRETGEFMGTNEDGTPHKGVAKEIDDRRD